MDKTEKAPEIHKVEKPQSEISTWLNGLGSGLMIGGGGPYAAEMVVKALKPETTFFGTGFKRFTLFSSVVGGAIGVAYSIHEAKQLNTYRAALAKDIENLHAKVDQLSNGQSAPSR